MTLDKLAYGYMVKYRLLTDEELEEFHDEFVKYLVVNGITAENWERLKEEENETATKILNLFSDTVLEGILRRTKFLEFRSKSYLQAVQCLDKKLIMFALSTENGSLDLTEEIDLNEHIDSLSLHRTEREYHIAREKEIFEMTTKGFQISQGELFKMLALAHSERTK